MHLDKSLVGYRVAVAFSQSTSRQRGGRAGNDFGINLPWSISLDGEMAIENPKILNSSTLL